MISTSGVKTVNDSLPRQGIRGSLLSLPNNGYLRRTYIYGVRHGSCWLTSVVARARVDPTGVFASLENFDAVVL